MVVIANPVKFDWDKGNENKNWLKHRVANQECEEAFEDKNKKIFKDPVHCETEDRYILIGATRNLRILFIVFTMRKDRVRVISARDLNKKEGGLYEEKINIAKI